MKHWHLGIALALAIVVALTLAIGSATGRKEAGLPAPSTPPLASGTRRTIVARGEAGGIGSPVASVDGAAPQDEQLAEKLALRAEADELAKERRKDLYVANLVSIEEAIAQAEEQGGNPEYIAALQKRAQLLQEQADAEAEQDELPPAP